MADFGLSEAAAIATIAGTAVSTVGAVSAGRAQAAESRYQAQVAANNAIIANQNANYATAAGEARATDEAMRARAVASATRAALAASADAINSGSAAYVRPSQSEILQLGPEKDRNTPA